MAAGLLVGGLNMKRDRKKRNEAIRRLEKLEDMNRAGENVSSLDLIGALSPKFVFGMWRGRRDKQACAELLEEVKSLVDIKDYITCPRSKEGRAIHIGDRVYKVDGDGEPLTVVKIIVRHDGAVVQCRYTNYMETNCENYLIRRLTKLSFFPRELTFDKPVNDGLYSKLNKLWGKSYHVIVVEEI